MRPWLAATVVVLCAAVLWPVGCSRDDGRPTVTVGSKNFTENRVLAEMFAQLIEAENDVIVDRSLSLADTRICFEHLKSGKIDVYPEYTGTGLGDILGEPPLGDSEATFTRVRDEFRSRWELLWLEPLGFENSYEIAVPRALAEKHRLRTIGDLAEISGTLTAAFGFEFEEREDCLPALRRNYGLEFADVKQMQQNLKYEAVAAGTVDCIDVYTTQARLRMFDLVVLADDKSSFPSYEAAALVRGASADALPGIRTSLEKLSARIDEDRMRTLNSRVDLGKEDVAAVAADALRDLNLVTRDDRVHLARSGNLFVAMWQDRARLWKRTVEHLWLTGAGVLLAVIVAIPLGLFLERTRRFAEPIVGVFGVVQTIPSLALLAFMLPLLATIPSLGRSVAAPAIAALWLYAIFPILKNTFVGVRDADPAAVDAATALGMTEGQVLRRVRLPLAMPVIMTGVRTAAVIAVGTATLGAFVGAGGLGERIITGLQSFNENTVLAGAIPAALLAIAIDRLLALVESWVRPRGVPRS